MKYSIGKAAVLLGVTETTLRNWERSGDLIPERTKGGHRRYRDDQLRKKPGIESPMQSVADVDQLRNGLDIPISTQFVANSGEHYCFFCNRQQNCMFADISILWVDAAVRCYFCKNCIKLFHDQLSKG